MHKVLFSALLVSAALGFNPALADESFAGPADTSPDWSGFYLGVTGGYGLGEVGLVTSSSTSELDGITRDFSTNGLLVGGAIGFNAQSGSFVYGIEGDVSWSGLSGDAAAINLGGEDAILTTDIDWLWTLRGRIGVAATDNLLLYATAGLASGGISGVVTNFPTDGTNSSTGGTQYGYVIGAGVEAALSDTMSVKAEVLHVDLGTGHYPLPESGSMLTAHAHVSTNVVRAGVNFSF